MTANRSIRCLRRAALGATVLAMAFPALADEPGSQARLAAALAPAGAYPLGDAALDAYRGAGLGSALAALIAALPPGYTAVATVNGVTLGNPPGQSTPQSIPPTTIGGTTVSATASNIGATSTSTSINRSSTTTRTRTFTFSRSF